MLPILQLPFVSGVWGSWVSWIPASSQWTCWRVSAVLLLLIIIILYLHNPILLSKPFCIVTPFLHPSPFTGWKLIPAAPAWTSITSLQPRTWQALLSGVLPPPFRSPTCPPLASAARGPNTSWSSKVSKTTTTHWRAPCERLLRQAVCACTMLTVSWDTVTNKL